MLVGVPPDFNGLLTNLLGVHDPSGAPLRAVQGKAAEAGLLASIPRVRGGAACTGLAGRAVGTSMCRPASRGGGGGGRASSLHQPHTNPTCTTPACTAQHPQLHAHTGGHRSPAPLACSVVCLPPRCAGRRLPPHPGAAAQPKGPGAPGPNEHGRWGKHSCHVYHPLACHVHCIHTPPATSPHPTGVVIAGGFAASVVGVTGIAIAKGQIGGGWAPAFRRLAMGGVGGRVGGWEGGRKDDRRTSGADR